MVKSCSDLHLWTSDTFVLPRQCILYTSHVLRNGYHFLAPLMLYLLIKVALKTDFAIVSGVIITEFNFHYRYSRHSVLVNSLRGHSCAYCGYKVSYFRLTTKYCIYCASAPSLHRESTDSIIIQHEWYFLISCVHRSIANQFHSELHAL